MRTHLNSRTHKSVLAKFAIFIALIAGSLSSYPASAVAAIPGCDEGGTCVTFETGTLFSHDDFGGQGWVSFTSIGATPTDGSSSSAASLLIHEQPGEQLWAGVTFFTGSPTTSLVNSSNKSVKMNVYAPAAGIPILLKIENSAVGAVAVENVQVTTSIGWQTLTFEYLTADDDHIYNKASAFINFGYHAAFTSKADRNWAIDDIRFPIAQPVPAPCEIGSSTLTYESGSEILTTFGDLSANIESAPPAGGSGKAAKLSKSPGNPVWAGVTIFDAPATLICAPESLVITAHVHAPASGRHIMLKLETIGGGASVESDAVTTQSGWQTLSFDFGAEGVGYNPYAVYNRASFFPDFGSTGVTADWYLDDVHFPTIQPTPERIAQQKADAIKAVWDAYYANPKYYEPTSSATAKLDLEAKTFTCTSPTSKNAPSFAAYYLLVDRKVTAAKRVGAFTTTPKYPSINAAVDGTATLNSATFNLDPAWNANRHTASLMCEIQLGTSLNTTVVSTGAAKLPGVGKYVRRSGVATETVKPSAVTIRLVSPAMVKDASGKPVDYVDFKNSPKDDNWAQYYGNADGGLGVFYRYLTAGSTLNLKYLVTDSDTKKPLANFPVWLMVNKNYGGIQRGSWSYENNGIVSKVAPLFSDIGESQFAGMTDAYGYVSFTLVNTNSADESEPTPAKLNAIQPASVSANVQSTITLTARLSGGEVKETKDFLWIHIVKP